MRWTVIYRPSAQDDLANAWLNAADREAVAIVADEIDQLLAARTLDVGESREGSRRVIIEPPLTVLFRAYPTEHRVSVIAVSYWRRRKE